MKKTIYPSKLSLSKEIISKLSNKKLNFINAGEDAIRSLACDKPNSTDSCYYYERLIDITKETFQVTFIIKKK